MLDNGLPLLLRHEFLLWWRGLLGRLSSNRRGYKNSLLLSLAALYLAVQLIVIFVLRAANFAQFHPSNTVLLLVTVVIVSISTFTMVTDLFFVVARAYVRGEADFIFSAPISQRAIFTSRLLRGAIGAAIGWLGLISPLINGLIWNGGFRYFSFYVAVFLLLAFAHFMANLLLLVIFTFFGAQRTRSIANFLAGFGLIFFIIASQSLRFLPYKSVLAAWVGRHGHSHLGVFLVPARALFGSWGAMGLLATFVLGVGVLMIACLSGPYERMMLRCGGAFQPAARGSKTVLNMTFQSLRWSLWRKEIISMQRNPSLWMQVFSSTAYLIPAAFSLGRTFVTNNHVDPAILAGSLVFLFTTVSSPILQLVFLNEGAPDLIGSAPITSAYDMRCKWQISTLASLTMLALPFIIVAVMSPLAALIALPMGLIGIFVQTLVYLVHQDAKVQFRNTNRMRLPTGAGLFTVLIALSSAGLTIFMMHGSTWALVPLGLLLATVMSLVSTRARRQLAFSVLAGT